MEKKNIANGATIWARQTIESDIFLLKPDKWFKIWFYIINKVRYKKMGRFDRGENFIKYEWITSATGATKNQIDHFLRWAKEAQMLATQKATRGMVVNVLKYEVYQDLDNYKSDTESELKATQERIKSDTILKKDKKDKKEKNTITKDIADKSASHDFKDIIAYYHTLVLNSEGFKPEIRAKDCVLVKSILKRYTKDQVKDIIYHYLSGEKAGKLGIDLSIALSAHSINQYLSKK